MVTATFGMVAATRAIDKLVAGTRRPSERVKPVTESSASVVGAQA
jgi:hypothetical protein